MIKQFESNYDEMLSSYDEFKMVDNSVIEKLTKYYITSDDDIINKKNFLKMKKEFYKIICLGDYDALQDKLYENKSKAEILSFELSRILKKKYDDPEMLEYIASIQSILSSYKGDITDNLYMDMVDIIISLELNLGMRVGLFRELCLIFSQKLHDIASKTTIDNEKRRR